MKIKSLVTEAIVWLVTNQGWCHLDICNNCFLKYKKLFCLFCNSLQYVDD